MLLLTVLCFSTVFAQTIFTSEEDLKKEAKKLFDSEQYAEAYPLYSQLLSVYPKDPNYNYRFGICMLYTSENKEKPISYLEYAAKQPDVEKDVFFFLGKAYHMNYRFDDAIVAFNRFKKEASSYQQKKLQVDKQIDMCRNGKTLLKNITDLQVLEKKQLSDKEFFRSYDLSSIGGKLLIKPEDFQSSLDKKAKEQTIIYLAKNNTQIYYSSYGTDGKNGKDIYMVTKLNSGEWSLPASLGPTINTDVDEDYPFLHPNGRVLYFCSKGHNSMGGYDIFKSTWNAQSGTWSEPVNMDFSINTPDDDIMFVTDSLEKTAYFSSKRTSPNNMIDVYRINTDRKPVDIAVINGTMGKDADGQFIKSKITVKNADNGELVGIFNSDPQTGEYSMNVPGGSKLLFTVETEGSKTQSEVVVLPTQRVFKPFKQEMNYESGTDKLLVKNFFDEAVDDNNYLLALNFIKEKAKMDVNANEAMFRDPQPAATQETKKDSASTATAPVDAKTSASITNAELVKIAYDDAEDIQKEAKELKNQADLALNYANEKNEEAQLKYKEANEAAAQSDVAGAEEKKKEGNRISRETVAAFNLAKKLDADAAAKQDEADLSLNYAKELDAAAKAKNSGAALTQLEEQKKRLESLSQKPKGADNAYSSIKLDADNKQKEVERTKEKSLSLAKDINNIDTEIKNLEQTAATSKNEQLKEGLKGQIKDLQDEKVKKQAEIVETDAKAVVLQKEADNLKNEAEIVSGMISQIKTGGEAPVNVSSIDKQKLQEQVNGYRMSDIAVPTTDAVISSTETGSPDKTTTSETKSVTDTTAEANNIKPEQYNKAITVKPVPSYDKKYIRKLDEANEINDDYTRETTKATYYKSWSDSISRDVEAKKTELAEIKDEEAKKEMVQTIAKMEVEAKEKQDLSDRSKAKAKAAVSGTAIGVVSAANSDSAKNETTEIAKNTVKESTTSTGHPVNNTSSEKSIKSNNNDSVPETSDQLAVNKTGDTGTSSIIKSEIKDIAEDTTKLKTSSSSGDIRDTTKSPASIEGENVKNTASSVPSNSNTELINSAAEKAKESKDLNEQAMTLRDEATSMSDPDERNEAIQKAEVIAVQAVQKQQEAADITAKIKTEEFRKKDEQLATQSKAIGDNQADDVLMAEMVRDEAKFYFEEAKKLREKAANYPSYDFKQEYLDQAEQKEIIAFEKQAKSAELYSKFKPEETPVTVSNTTTTNNSQPANNTVTTAAQPTETVTPATTNTNEQTANNTVKSTEPSVKSETPAATTKNDAQAEPDGTTKLKDESTQTIKSDTTAPGTSEAKVKATTPVAADTQEKQTSSDQQQTAENKQQPVDQKKAAEETSSNVPVTQQEVRKVQDTREYGHYVDVRAQSDSSLQIAKLHHSSAADYQRQADAKRKEADPILKQVDEVPEGTPVPDELAQKVASIKGEVTFYQQKADSAKILARNAEEVAAAKLTESESFLETLDDNKSKQIIAAYNAKDIPVSTAADNQQTATQAKFSVPKTAKQPAIKSGSMIINALAEGFEVSNGTVYTNDRPIPIDPKLPEGLVFKVQIGAFKNPIAQDAFRGMNPISAETTQRGLIRYTAGLFRDLSPANAAKSRIQAIGYRDAFVVAFYNGKRISYGEAMAMVNGGKVPEVASNTIPQNTPAQTNVTESAVIQKNNTGVNTNNSQTQISSQETSIAKTTDIATVSGVVYTVQVGVYSKPVSSAQLFNIGSLYTETMKNGLIRYTSGAYTDITEATKAKGVIVARGVRDAFIIVYKDGKRATGTDLVQRPKANGNTETVKSENTSSSALAQDIVFKVQVGAYKSEVPIEMANKFLSIATKGVNVNKDEAGMTIYSVGKFKTYEEALTTKNELVSSGIADAFVVAYNKDKRMNLDEAKQLINK
ncbi:MAG: PD40 domain-containing protein [Bacteroidetes bacterium]|nr:PD40 domain-containing protein [Bacteroidota bacterium]